MRKKSLLRVLCPAKKSKRKFRRRKVGFSPSVGCADSSLDRGSLARADMKSAPTTLSVSLTAATSPGGRGFLLPAEGSGALPASAAAFPADIAQRGPGKPARLCHSVSPAILGTFGAQKYRIGAGHADVLPYHSCRRHTARFLPPSRYACYLPHQREALCTGRRPILQFPQGNHFTHQYQGP